MLLVVASQIAGAQSSSSRRPSVEPRFGFVPDSITAIRVGEAVLTPIWGEKDVESSRPFSAQLMKGVWWVRGVRKGNLGGPMEVDIARKDGRILRIWRNK